MEKKQKEKIMKKENKKKKTTKAENNSKEKSSVLTIVSGIALGLVLVFAIIAVDLISKMGLFNVHKDPSITPTGFVEVTEDGEQEFLVETLEELRGMDSLSDVLKSWAVSTTDKNIMQDKNVINFLLIGLDESENNSDAIIIASLNKVDEKIYLTSVFRDSYTYMNTVVGDRYAKINACYANGGAQKLKETIENNFKIKIDYYVSVNFESFKNIIDILGGIRLDVKQYESEAAGYGCPAGDNVLLNGEQALAFCRIRYCDADADVSRTRRQRQFITALIDETKDISLDQITPLLNEFIKYVKTDCSVANIVSLATQAITNKWYNYSIESSAIPSEEHRLDYRGNAWVWIVDYPAAAKALQEKIYGKTNIVLNENRVSAIDIMKNSGNSGNAAP